MTAGGWMVGRLRSARHRRCLAATGLALIALVGACSGGDDDSGRGAGDEALVSTSDVACSKPAAADEAPAAHVDDCLAPSVGFVKVGDFGAGSGMLVEREGETYVLTNLHVVDPDPVATVELPAGADGEPAAETLRDVEVLGVDVAHDVALLGPVETDRPAVRLEDAKPAKGDEVYLVGYPAETDDEPEATISEGIVSRLRTDEPFEMTYVQTDATIEGGQSGGALADASGTVIGMSGLSFGEDDGFALALSADDVNDAVERILAGDGDDYWTFPPADGTGGDTTGSVELVGAEDLAMLLVESAPKERTLELTLEPSTGAAISVIDWDSGEPIFVDRAAFVSGLEMVGETVDPTKIDELAAQEGITLGDPVSPGRYEVTIPPKVPVEIDLGLTALDAAATTVTWSSNIPTFFRADDEIDVPLRVGELHEGVLDYMEVDATFLVELEEGTTYDVSVHTNGGDPGIVIEAPGESYLDAWSADDSDAGLFGFDVDEEFTAEATGTHSVIVENYTGSAIAYQLLVAEQDADADA